MALLLVFLLRMHSFIPLGFASMATVPYAHVVAKILDRKKKQGAIITLAPNPKDIVRFSSLKSFLL